MSTDRPASTRSGTPLGATTLLAGAACTLLAAVALLATASPAQARAPQSFFGANALYPSAADFDSMESAGVGTYRFVLYWQGAQAEPHGPYNWGQADRLIYPAVAAGMRPLPILLGTPPFIGDSPTHLTPPIRTKLARNEWARFVKAAVARYRPGGTFWREHPELPPLPVRYWQIWNEQNAVGYWWPQADPGEYARLLRISDKAIAKVDPAAQVLLGGMYGYPSSAESIYARQYLAGLYREPGIRRSFDAVAIHPFGASIRDVRRQIGVARAVMRRHHDGPSKVWITEVGWGTPPGRDRNPFAVGRKRQAKLLRRTVEMLVAKRRDWNLKGVTWFTWRDFQGSGGCVWCEHAGLQTKHGRDKPALTTYRRLIRRNTAG